jgi:hypothetical protein
MTYNNQVAIFRNSCEEHTHCPGLPFEAFSLGFDITQHLICSLQI